MRLAVLITTKKEICIDLALNPLFYLAGLPCCGFPSTFPVSALPSGARAEQRQSPERVFKTFLDESGCKFHPLHLPEASVFSMNSKIQKANAVEYFNPCFILLVWKYQRKREKSQNMMFPPWIPANRPAGPICKLLQFFIIGAWVITAARTGYVHSSNW